MIETDRVLIPQVAKNYGGTLKYWGDIFHEIGSTESEDTSELTQVERENSYFMAKAYS